MPCACLLMRRLLNEVLSLNAQELPSGMFRTRAASVLNEVLSLNAQECER